MSAACSTAISPFTSTYGNGIIHIYLCPNSPFLFHSSLNTGYYLYIIDIGDPNNVVELETKTTTAIAKGFYISGTYAYVADNGGGIKIFSINYLYETSEPGGDGDLGISSFFIPILIIGLALGVLIVLQTNCRTKIKSKSK